ncbi:gamma-tubulin complex, DGRIP91/SPC98 component protein [Mycena maculata]|uniref:Spindle pole body component n=1 Tax=Mycena maculata TaxID=230809 RepID=A0AAD7JVK3_9AGAR|nr:gamma-tubulin complex, DGRIP91/SPC98 component protein [Mycena maculata]
MSLFRLPVLHDEFDSEDSAFQAVLPEFKPRFFVPPMLEKPQNPIMDTLRLTPTKSVPAPLRLQVLPPELASLTFDIQPPRFPKLNDSIWADALKGGLARSEILSWDALRPNYPGRPPPNAFISEQDNLVFAAARYYVQPRLNDPGAELKYVTQKELLTALKMSVLGISSPLHAWDPISETFVQIVSVKGAHGIMLVDDKDEVVSGSFISRFLAIGTLLRRLEILLASLQSRFAKEGPTIHAFTHALSTVISFLREALSRCSDEIPTALSAVWKQYEQYEEILTSLAALCGRSQHKPPRDYTILDHTPINLLSLLYDHLHSHMECQAPPTVTAIVAFILTSTSREYLQQLSRSVGFGGDSTLQRPSRVVGEHNDQYALDVSDDGIEERDELDSIGDTFPTFFPPLLVDVLSAAQKSLVLLRAAEPDHPLLRVPGVHCAIEWFWTWGEIEGAWNGQESTSLPKKSVNVAKDPVPHGGEPGLAQFRIFDLEPGSHFGHSLLDDKSTPTPVSALQDFIDAFPTSLPPITPTLSHLTSLVFEPLIHHASKLSRTLLSLFLSSSAPLQFKPHMELLHSYPLLASPSFKSRLTAALFSDSQGYDADEPIPTTLRSMRRKVSEKRDRAHRWPVGLSWALLERETWPPVGADLSFFLRTVIVDSFEIPDDQLVEGDAPSSRETFWVEAERRLGFAIRDLPTGPGHDQWLNPLSIEALDFLYMDYKAPHPLDILITPDILSKYQRMFTYLLRIMRVEHALSSVFRMCRSAARPLFPTLTPSNKLLLHLRFIAHSFVASLSEYVFDTAIGGNFDPFLARLTEPAEGQTPAFSDVFALARAHSALMDDVLSACLLRSGQKGAGDLLRQALELVLEFAVLVGDLKTGWLQEYQAAPLLADLAHRFRAKMAALSKTLKALVDKGPLPVDSELDRSPLGHGPKRTGGIEAIAHLSELLSDWWSNETSVVNQ